MVVMCGDVPRCDRSVICYVRYCLFVEFILYMHSYADTLTHKFRLPLTGERDASFVSSLLSGSLYIVSVGSVTVYNCS